MSHAMRSRAPSRVTLRARSKAASNRLHAFASSMFASDPAASLPASRDTVDLEVKTPVVGSEMYLGCEGRRPERPSRVQGGSPGGVLGSAPRKKNERL